MTHRSLSCCKRCLSLPFCTHCTLLLPSGCLEEHVCFDQPQLGAPKRAGEDAECPSSPSSSGFPLFCFSPVHFPGVLCIGAGNAAQPSFLHKCFAPEARMGLQPSRGCFFSALTLLAFSLSASPLNSPIEAVNLSLSSYAQEMLVLVAAGLALVS